METNPQREFKTVKEKVEFILENYPKTRGGSPLLTILFVWKYCDGFDIDPEEFLQADLTEIETIRRARQFIQNKEGKFLPSAEELEQREEREKEIRKFIAKPEEEWIR